MRWWRIMFLFCSTPEVSNDTERRIPSAEGYGWTLETYQVLRVKSSTFIKGYFIWEGKGIAK
ncbi:hypothetical protein CEXT_153061, partial [Caerostris extrusa]